MSEFRILVQPEGRTLTARADERLLDALHRGGVSVRNACGGKGVCGRCSVTITEDGVSHPVLACQHIVNADLEVLVPASSRLEPWARDQQGLASYQPPALDLPEPTGEHGMLRLVTADLPVPTASDNVSDLDRLARFLSSASPDAEISIPPATARHLPRVLRDANWRIGVCVARTSRRRLTVTDVRSAARPPHLLAMGLDCGTTTLEVALIDVSKREVVGHVACLNPQSAYGADVISRIVHAGRREGLLALHRVVRDAVRSLGEQALEQAGRSWQDLQLVLAAGNTTMLHLLHHVDPSHLRKDPYVPAFTTWDPVPLSALGITGAPGALLMTLPSVSSYVGADVVAGLLATGAVASADSVALVDLGTNGEIALGCRDWMLCCASSAGPCFEGGGITWGCPATQGAIHRVSIVSDDTSRVAYETIGEAPPVGLCGSGVLDAVASLFRAGIIDRRGKLDADHALVRSSDGGELEVVVVAGDRTPYDQDIVLTQGDIENVIRAKAAIFAGLESCLEAAGSSAQRLRWLALAGGFGAALDTEKASAIGLLPPLPKARLRTAGNSALTGVCAAVTDEDVWARAEPLARMMTTLELSTDQAYMDRYTAALFIPHTDLARFTQGAEEASA